MKKIVCIIVLLVNFSFANAQEIKSKKGENYLPETGDWAIGFGTNGIFKYLGNAFNGKLDNEAPNPSFVQEGSFVGKKFITDKKAIRVIANFQLSKLNLEISEEENNVVEKLKGNISTFNLKLGLGKEWRKGKTRLQGFYGADVFIQMNSSKLISINQVGEKLGEEQKLSGGLGINGFIGAEYFIFPKMALGAQYTYVASFNYLGDYSKTEQEKTVSFSGNSYGVSGVGITAIYLTLYF